MIPSREMFWNIGDVRTLVHLLMFIPLLSLILGVLYHFRLWRFGKSGKILRQIPKRVAAVLLTIFSHRTILKDRYAGVMHLFIFWGFWVLFLGTLTVFVQDSVIQPLFESKFLKGGFYLFFKVLLELSGILVILGASMAVYRRYVLKPSKLDARPEDAFVFIMIFLLILSGFTLEGLRISLTKPSGSFWSPVGFFFGSILESIFRESWRLALHRALWWIHLGLAFFFIASLPFSKLFHIFSSPFNLLVNSFDSTISMKPLDFNAQRFGVNRIKDFEWDSLLALDACTECGRCQEVCPAHLSEKPLNPKKVILGLQKQMRQEGRLSLNRKSSADLIGKMVIEEEIWNCTTCLACVKKCPVFIEPMKDILELRRYLILTESKIPQEIERVHRNLEWYGDPLGMGKISRDELIQSIQTGKTGNGGGVNLLFWVGCQGYFHERNRKTISTLLRLLQKLDVRFTLLGREERCCGDLARRTGNEYLFKKIAEENIEFFKGKGITKIVTHCPHCFNVFKNEYSQLGGKLTISHYTELLDELLDKKLPSLQREIVGKAAFHDPCYLSRYNGMVLEPRRLLSSIPGLEIVEMDRSKKETFCCGAGGGGQWLGRQIGKRMNEIRVEEAFKTKADYLVTACPYCLNMLEDGIKGSADGVPLSTRSLQVIDLIELFERAIV